MKTILLFACLITFVHAQTFRLLRPVEDKYQIHGGYLYGEQIYDYPHKGVDFQTPMSSPIYSASDGFVDYKSYEANGAGYYIRIKSKWEGHDIWLYYMHLSDYSTIQIGDSVDAGDQIALSGNTGNSTGPHMHFEIRQDNRSSTAYMNRRNPELWVAISGMGAICGKVPNASNGTRVDINPDPKPRPPYTTYSYTLTYTFDGKIGIDDIYQENYAIGEVKPGTYTITSINGYNRTVTVSAGEVVNVDPPTTIETELTPPDNFTMVYNYPNPFNNVTTIAFQIEQSTEVGIYIYDAQGKVVQNMQLGNLNAGRYDVKWDAANNATGIYFGKLITKNEVKTTKMVLVK